MNLHGAMTREKKKQKKEKNATTKASFSKTTTYKIQGYQSQPF